jgi:glycosyltransferase involved in cell wall biosynthesis
MKKKRILLVSDTKDWGGWKRAIMMKKYLSDEFYFDIMDAEEFNDFEKNSTVDVFSVSDVKSFAKQHPEVRGNDLNHLSLQKFQKWLNNNKTKKDYDLYYFLFHTMLIKKSVKRTLAKKKVITMVTVYPVIRPGFIKNGASSGKGNFSYAEENFLNLANKCEAILANNIKSLNDLKRIYKGNTYIATRGVDPDVFYPLTDKFIKKPHNEFTIAFCGKPNPEKGFKSIIEPACKEAGVRLIDNQRNFTDALSEDDMRAFYNQADAYIVASTMDGTPNTALEAASCGKPILTNEIGNMPEFIKNGHNGFLIPLKLNKYINRIRWMAINQKRTFEMGQNARETILENWTWEKVLNKNERRILRRIT